MVNAVRKTELYKGASIKDVMDLKISTKRFRQSNHRELLNHSLWGYNKGNTGGSTGEPLTFEYGIEVWEAERIHQQFLYALYGISRRNAQIVSFSGMRPSEKAIRGNRFWRRRLFSWPYGTHEFSSLFLNIENIASYVSEFNHLNPNVVRGYPSAICDFIRLINEKKISVYPPAVVLLTSETISREQIRLIKSSWNCEVICQYGMSEAVVFAFTFGEYEGYYCSPFYGKTEIVDDRGLHVSVGEIGRIVATSFSNFRQPFIRYETGDLGRYDGVSNGFVKISSLEGRTSDFVFDKFGVKIMLVGLVFGHHSEVFGRIINWQIVQTKKGEISMRLRVDDSWDCTRDELLVQNMFPKISVCFDYNGKMDKTKLGKRPFLIQEVEE